MKAIRHFQDFINDGTIKIQHPDKSRAEFLIKEAENGYLFLQEMLDKIGLRQNNANDYIKSCYDILMELIRAKMLLEGYNATGQGAHEAEVSYLRVLNFKETEVQFANQLRYFRNGMLYYGTILEQEYAEKVIEFTKKNYDKVKRITKEDLN